MTADDSSEGTRQEKLDELSDGLMWGVISGIVFALGLYITMVVI